MVKKINNKLNDIKIKIKVDFKENSFKVLLNMPIRIEFLEESDGLLRKRFYLDEEQSWQKVLEKGFKISEDFKFISVENISYIIPNPLYRNLIKDKNKKIFETILNQVLNFEISEEIKKYKTLVTILEQKRDDDLSGRGIDNKIVVANF